VEVTLSPVSEVAIILAQRESPPRLEADRRTILSSAGCGLIVPRHHDLGRADP
jgi:hypothetical protein